MIAARYASLLAFAQARAFCPNGEGNGVTNDCSPKTAGGGDQSAKSFPKGSKPLRDAVDSVAPAPDKIWDRSKGLAETPPPKQIDDIAAEQSSHSGAALTPEAEASYKSLVDEIGRQYEALTAAGLKARAWRGEGEPYGDPPGSTKPNSNKMREEVAKTGEFNFFMTDKGFGTGDATPNHPMLRETKYKTADGEPMIANDLFRVVHDMVAHVRGGYSFSTNGEYNGMLTHASALPESAWPALFAETFGQNAVYEKTKNYAPQNAYASKIGPEIIRSELKKRTKSSRDAKVDSDEPLGYQHLKVRPWLMKQAAPESRGDAPAPPKDRIKGSDVNDEGSAKNKSGDISLDESTISALKAKAKEHNAAMRERKKPDWTHVRLSSLKAVYRRGAGAFSTSHRPGMTRDRWAMARVNAFLTLASRGRPENSKYVSDNDLLHSKHPRYSKETRSYDCGREDDGKFASGNKCGGQVEMPKEDPRGRLRYDNGVQTDAARKLYQMGSSEKKLKALVDVMGGDAKTTRVDINPPSLNISVADKDGNKLYHVDFENGRARVYPTKDLSSGDADKIKDAAAEAFGSTQADTKITVYRKAEDIKKWESENAAKIKKWEDKYKFSTLLPPHQRPKKWERSIDARYASLIAFTQARAFCPNGEGNGVTNDCGSKGSQSRPDPSSKPLPSYANDIEHTMPKSRGFDDPKNSQAWLSPTGTFFPVSGDHGEYARDHGVEGGGDELLDAGWVRVAGHSGDTLFVGNPSGFTPKGRQISSLKDFAISTGRIKRIVFDNGKSSTGRVLWQSDERSIDARYASLLAFAEARNCGQDPDGKFSKGNTCASGLASDAASGAAKGAALGAVSGFAKTFLPHGAATGAAVGAVAGAVKGLYDNQMRPTRVSNRMKSLGLKDEDITNIVTSLKGSPKSVATTTGRSRLTVRVKDASGKTSHVIDFTHKTVTIYPRTNKKELSDKELDAIKQIAKDNSTKQTRFAVKTDSLSYAKRIARNGFEVAANKAGLLIATAVVSGAAPSVPDFVLGVTDLAFDTHFTDSFYHAKRR